MLDARMSMTRPTDPRRAVTKATVAIVGGGLSTAAALAGRSRTAVVVFGLTALATVLVTDPPSEFTTIEGELDEHPQPDVYVEPDPALELQGGQE
jgi:hypothetical protein